MSVPYDLDQIRSCDHGRSHLNFSFAKLCGRCRAFGVDRGGNVAITFGLAFVPLVAAVGMGIGYSRANSFRAHMQAAADAAALYAATGSYSSDSQRVTAAVNEFNANLHSRLASASPTAAVANGAVTVTAAGNVATTIFSAFGVDTLAV